MRGRIDDDVDGGFALDGPYRAVAVCCRPLNLRDCLRTCIQAGLLEGVGDHEASDAGKPSGSDVETPGALTVQATPVAEPAEGPLHDPTPLQNNEALLIWAFLDEIVAQSVEMTPLPAALGGEGAVEEGQTQAGPSLLTVAQRRLATTELAQP
ncbi:UNVERIFIED_ORG: hypothetical protein M2442_002781 [Methylorubrum zatmanii]|nr:hypothetical protein [Methylorubrum zatmanii]